MVATFVSTTASFSPPVQLLRLAVDYMLPFLGLQSVKQWPVKLSLSVIESHLAYLPIRLFSLTAPYHTASGFVWKSGIVGVCLIGWPR